MPTTCPLALISGPPELPGFTATSVWMKGTMPSSGSERPLALTTPAVTLFSKPNGEPMASTHSPTASWRVLPSGSVGKPLASILSTATSVLSSWPSTLALNSRRSVNLTVTSSAPRTTWALVRIRPSALTMKPEPWPRIGASCAPPRPPGAPPKAPGGMPKRRRKSCISGGMPCAPRWAAGAASSSSPSAPFIDTLRVPLTLMLTTAGPYWAVMALKLGMATVGAAVLAAGATWAVTACARAGVCACSTATTPAPPSTPAASKAATSFLDLSCKEFISHSFR